MNLLVIGGRSLEHLAPYMEGKLKNATMRDTRDIDDVNDYLRVLPWDAVLIDWALNVSRNQTINLAPLAPKIALNCLACGTPVIGILLPRHLEQKVYEHKFLEPCINGIGTSKILLLDPDVPTDLASFMKFFETAYEKRLEKKILSRR